MRRLVAVVVLLALAMAACGGATTGESVPAASPSPPPVVDELQLNDLRVLGSHNSYHVRPEPAVLAAISAVAAPLAESIDYSHVSLTRQLDEFGVRQFEIDVFADPDGGLYAVRAALPIVGLPAESGLAALDEPGFKVLHTQDFDFATTCLTLELCLGEIAAWSDANPGHLPLLVMIELKEESVPEAAEASGVTIPELGIEWTLPVVTDEPTLAALDAELLAAFGRDRVITPDDVRGDATTLEEVVLADGWPTLAASRGKVMFALVNTGAALDLYRAPSPVLAGRVMFTTAEPGDPDAAFLRIDDPVENGALIDELATAGYLIRTRTDVPTIDAREGRTQRRDAALASGAHFLSTDYYLADPALGTGYAVVLDGRCNPITAPATCDPAQLVD